MVSNFTVCRNFSQSALHCYHHSQNTLLVVFIQYWNCFNFGMEFVCLSIHILAILWHCMITNFRFMVRSRVISKCSFFSLSVSYWPYMSSFFDIVCGLSFPFRTSKGLVDIRKNRGWNLMGIAHYAIRLVCFSFCGLTFRSHSRSCS